MGSANASHYDVLLNECKLSEENLMRNTHYLSYLYYNWLGPVKVPSVCQYAHKLAYLIGATEDNVISEKIASKLYYL
jgi:aubergine-like protein